MERKIGFINNPQKEKVKNKRRKTNYSPQVKNVAFELPKHLHVELYSVEILSIYLRVPRATEMQF